MACCCCRSQLVEWLDPVERALGDILHGLASGSSNVGRGGALEGTPPLNHRKSKMHIGNLIYHLGDERIYDETRDQPWWADEEILARAKAPYDKQADWDNEPPNKEPMKGESEAMPTATIAPKKKKKGKRKKKDEL